MSSNEVTKKEVQITIDEIHQRLIILRIALKVGGEEYSYDDWLDMVDTLIEDTRNA